jgi:hypothetical protein
MYEQQWVESGIFPFLPRDYLLNLRSISQYQITQSAVYDPRTDNHGEYRILRQCCHIKILYKEM